MAAPAEVTTVARRLRPRLVRVRPGPRQRVTARPWGLAPREEAAGSGDHAVREDGRVSEPSEGACTAVVDGGVVDSVYLPCGISHK